MIGWLWQNVVDFWSLAHCGGWGLGAALVAVLTSRLRLLYAVDTSRTDELRWRVRILDRPVVLFWIAVAVGIGWEAVEAAWIEPWLHFREPAWNRVADVFFDALGARIGIRMVIDRQKKG